MGLTTAACTPLSVSLSKSPTIPKYGLASPFKGHFSTKSNAFSTGSSGRLSDQYRIRDHMVVHYSKILSAKAAVDCSMPKSLTTSIKYSDQQRREKLKRDISRLEKEVLSVKTFSRPSSGGSSRPVSAVLKKSLLGAQDIITISPCAENRHLYSARSSLSLPEQCLILPARETRESTRISVHSSMSGHSIGASSSRRLFHSPVVSSDGSIHKDDRFHHFQDPSGKTYSGDLLDRHSHHFTDNDQPFTPRTLKTQAKSILSQYRYYTPPRRKRREGVKEAGTQTDISFLRRRAPPQRIDGSEPQRERQQTQCVETSSTSEMEEKLVSFQPSVTRTEWNKQNIQQYSWPRFPFPNELSPSPVMQKIKSEEEQLQYLEFAANITNEILTLGLFSNRVLERVFERHVDENRHRLDESKMRHLLDGLKRDLGYHTESSANLNSGEMFGFLLRESSETRLTPDNETLSEGREKNDLRTRGLTSDHQKQIEQLLQKEIGGPLYGQNIPEGFLPEDQMQPQSVVTDRGTDPLASDRDVDPLASDRDVDPLASDRDVDPLASDWHVDPLASDRDPLSFAHHKERPDALHTPEPTSNATDYNSDLGDAEDSKELDELPRYFAESVQISMDEEVSISDLPEYERADLSRIGHEQNER